MNQTLDYARPQVKEGKRYLPALAIGTMLYPVAIHAVLGLVWLDARLKFGHAPVFGDPSTGGMTVAVLTFLFAVLSGAPVFAAGYVWNVVHAEQHSASPVKCAFRLLIYVSIWVAGTILFVQDIWNHKDWVFD